MSLLFESAIDVFDPRDATVFTTADPSVYQRYRERRLPIETITSYAVHHDRLRHPEHEDWTCIPLHERESAALTGDYLAYTTTRFVGRSSFTRHTESDRRSQPMSLPGVRWRIVFGFGIRIMSLPLTLSITRRRFTAVNPRGIRLKPTRRQTCLMA